MNARPTREREILVYLVANYREWNFVKVQARVQRRNVHPPPSARSFRGRAKYISRFFFGADTPAEYRKTDRPSLRQQ